MNGEHVIVVSVAFGAWCVWSFMTHLVERWRISEVRNPAAAYRLPPEPGQVF